MAEPVAIMALLLDAAIGWPPALYRRIGHPVNAFASIINRCAFWWNRPSMSPSLRQGTGVITVLLLTLVAGASGLALEQISWTVLQQWGWLGCAVFAAPGLAQRSLFDHVRAIQRPLESGDLASARTALSMIVGRDVQALDEAGISRAAIESLAESFCDGVVAPLFWLLIFGLPGLWIYKAINTADSLIGHREEQWRAFGWAAARTDDLLNLVPARMGGFILCLVGGGGWRIMWRDARKHASPNAGWTEAAMAGALDLRLAGPVSYDGVVQAKQWIGDGKRDASGADLRRALAVYVRGCLALWVIAGGVAWAL